METPDGSNTRVAVRTWIEQTPESDAEQSEDGEGSFASLLYESCMNLFNVLYKESARSGSFSRTERRYLEENLGRLFLWGDGFGEGMLDRILGQSIELRDTVLGFIAGIGRVLTGKVLTIVCETQQEGKISKQATDLDNLIKKVESIIVEDSLLEDNDSEQDSDSDALDCSKSDILEDISSYTLCLMELVPSMERTLALLDERQTEGLPPTVSFQVLEPARAYVQNILDKFPRADIKLVERLGGANWQRHMSVRQRMEDLSCPAKAVQDDGSINPGAGNSIFRRCPEFLDSGLGTTVVPQSTYAASAASYTSIGSSSADRRGKSRINLSIPYEVAAGKPFQCKICGKMLENVTHSKAWTLHVLADIRPYICTFSICKDEFVKFPTRKLWANHEFSEHRVEKVWHCMECADIFAEVELWRKHVGSRHGIFFSAPQFQSAAALAEKKMPGLLEHTQCPLCLDSVGRTRRAFATHVGKHMEMIALTALPPEMSYDTESEAEESEKATYNACTEDRTEGITHQSEVTPNPRTINAIESEQEGGIGLGTEHLTQHNPPEPSEPKSHLSSFLSTDMAKLQPKHEQDFSLLPPTRSAYQEHPQDSDRGGSSHHIELKRPATKEKRAISCRQCKRRLFRRSGFTVSENGRCVNCQRLGLDSSYAHLTSQAQASVPAHTPYQNLRNREPFVEEYPFPITVPGAHVSYSAFFLQSRVPEKRWVKVPDTTILQSLAELFVCTEFNFGTVNLRVLKITLRCEAMKVAYLVDREDTQQFELTTRSIDQQVKLQLLRNKDNRIQVELFIEPNDTHGPSLDHGADGNEDQPLSPQLWNSGTPVGERLVAPDLPKENFPGSVMKPPKSIYSNIPKKNPSALPTQEPLYGHPEPSNRAEIKTQVEGGVDGEYTLPPMECQWNGASEDREAEGKRKESEFSKRTRSKILVAARFNATVK